MFSDTSEPILELLATAADVPARLLSGVSDEVRGALLDALRQPGQSTARVALPEGVFLGLRYEARPSSVVVLGPLEPVDGDDALAREERLRALLKQAGVALASGAQNRSRRLELVSQREMLSSAIIAISSELSLDAVLRRIVDLAREVAGARYAALGVPNEAGELGTFITSGLTAQEEARLAHPPRGRGILGLLLKQPGTLRLPDLTAHPASVGFPEHHPVMRSFLGVSIVGHGRVLGNLYLTEKRGGAEFTPVDAQLVELLAAHAAVAIKHAQLYERLESQEQTLREIVDHLPEAVILVARDPERVVLANPQTSVLLGWDVHTPMPLDDFLRMNQRLRADGTPIPYEDVHLTRALRDGVVTTREEIQIALPDGRMVTMLVNAAPVREDGRVVSAVAVFQDITQIKDAERFKDDILSLVSHELRTPLTTIHGGAQMLLHDGDALDPETRAMLLQDMASESRRLANLVENTVQLANIRAGRLVMETEPIHVRRLVERAVDAAAAQAPDRVITTDLEPHLLALGDANRLDQVLRNLISNAIKYSPDGSPIEVTARADADMVEFGVRDHGPGIDTETLPLLFTRFQRGAKAERSGVSGMGLGLYLCKNLVETLGGRIWVEQPEGGGTRMLFTVPRVMDD